MNANFYILCTSCQYRNSTLLNPSTMGINTVLVINSELIESGYPNYYTLDNIL